MIGWTKDIRITIGYKDKVDCSDKRKKKKDLIITNNKSNSINGKFSSVDSEAILKIDGKEYVVEAEWMKEAMEKIIALGKI